MTSPSVPLLHLEERMRVAASHGSLFPVIRRLEVELGGLPVGTAARAAEERIHFSHPPSLVLPAGEIVDIRYEQSRDIPSATVTTSLLGLVGAESPMPPAMTEEVVLDDETGALGAFYDVFQHRAVSLLYRAWKRYDVGAALRASSPDAFSRELSSLVGTDAFSPYAEPEPDAALFSLGLSDFVRCDPNALDVDALQALLARVFPELSPRIRPTEPEVVHAAEEDRGSLGVKPMVLGVDASYGTSALDPAGTIRVALGPLDRATYEKLLPGGALHQMLCRFFDHWLASRARVELEVRMAPIDAPALCLGHDYGARLGLDAQYRSPDVAEVRLRIPLSAQAVDLQVEYVDGSMGSDRTVARRSGPRATPALSAAAAPSLALPDLREMPVPPCLRETFARASFLAARGWTESAIDQIVAALDGLIATMVDGVLHNPSVQRIEAAWRGLDYLAEQVPPDENVILSLLDCSKESLRDDLESSAEIARSRIFASVYSNELGTLGGRPYAAIFADMEFDSGPRDIELLRKMTALGAMAHAPLFAAAAPGLLHIGDSWRGLPHVRSARAIFDSPTLLAWNRLRDNDDSRAGGLLVGRPLQRVPYDESIASGAFPYTETISAAGEGLLFGSPIYVVAARLARSFARHRTLGAIVGDDIDACAAPAVLTFPSLGPRYARPPLEVTITPRLERELREVGLVALMHRTENPRIFLASAHSLQRPKHFATSAAGAEAELNHLLGTRFPYFFLACRFAHYVKALEREAIGAGRSASDVGLALNEWISQYVLQMNAASPSMRARYPLRAARVLVTPIEESPGWNHAKVEIRPHLRYLDRLFTLSVTNLIAPSARAALPPAHTGTGDGAVLVV